MDTSQQSSNARYAAIAALVAAFVVIVVLIGTSLGGDDSGPGPQRSGGQGQSKSQGSEDAGRRIYVVKPGDCCLSQIAQKTGIDVDVLVQLNPKLDPQAIHSGDRVKLR